MMLYLILASIIIAADQLLKFWTVANIALGETLFQNKIMSLTYLQNKGAAWNILEGHMWFFYIITTVCVIVILYMLYRNLNENKWLTVGLALILGGALGNFIDRLRLGYVVDMFQIEWFNFPIFNIADAALSVGVGCIFIYILFDDKKE